jgi:hypothetical protein
MIFLIRLAVVTSLLLMGGLAQAQQTGDLFVFPNNGQDQDQQDLDTLQCQRVARDSTGFDPSQRPQAYRNAVIGGAAAGGLLGGARSSRNNRQNDQRQQQWEQQQMAEYNRNRSNWNRAFSGCMESRGYTIS